MTRDGNNTNNEPCPEMYRAILALETLDECVRFFDDLCSKAELRAIEQRFQVARMLRDGHVYSAIQEKTGASSATISRVNRSLNYGKDSYDVIFKRLDKENGGQGARNTSISPDDAKNGK